MARSAFTPRLSHVDWRFSTTAWCYRTLIGWRNSTIGICTPASSDYTYCIMRARRRFLGSRWLRSLLATATALVQELSTPFCTASKRRAIYAQPNNGTASPFAESTRPRLVGERLSAPQRTKSANCFVKSLAPIRSSDAGTPPRAPRYLGVIGANPRPRTDRRPHSAIPSFGALFPHTIAFTVRSGIRYAHLIEIEFPDGTTRRSHERWREKVAEAERRYKENKTGEAKAEYLRILKAFADLTLRRKRSTE